MITAQVCWVTLRAGGFVVMAANVDMLVPEWQRIIIFMKKSTVGDRDKLFYEHLGEIPTGLHSALCLSSGEPHHSE